MTKREVVLQTLRHEQTDVIPYYLDLTEGELEKMIAFTGDKEFFEHSDSYLAQERNESFTDLGGGMFKDMFGVTWNVGAQEGDFGVVKEFPIPEADFGDYVFPEPDEALIREKCERLVQQKDKFTMYIIGFSLYERAWTLHSTAECLMDFLEEPEFMGELLDKIVEYNCKVVDIVAQYPIDCVFFGDDWGQQIGLQMGYPIWKEFIKPRLKIMYDHVKKYGMFVSQHSCGDCRQVFPDLVELGLDIYNTFQPEVYDIVEFKKLYGDHITFFGGISTQRILPFKTPEEVKKNMHEVMDVLGKNGGYILAPTHAMPNDIPPENVLAFMEVAKNENPR
ncbi:MAG: uroporphyrinogen decarboxylase [Clostridia bacterium]|nr:uroporphyrinogen decarboxylase [Clostridia bacterium]NCC43422.1 uroporphyrinogen decarboxylase [Clostridia bacterium]